MTDRPEIVEELQQLLGELLQNYDQRVPEDGAFNDHRVRKQIYYDDPATTMPGILEIAVMNMDEQLNPAHRTMRFVAVRVKKSPRGGSVSSTCFHGSKSEVRTELEQERKSPSVLLDKIIELASGLSEETNPGLWR